VAAYHVFVCVVSRAGRYVESTFVGYVIFSESLKLFRLERLCRLTDTILFVLYVTLLSVTQMKLKTVLMEAVLV
jgi:hypothetical protein